MTSPADQLPANGSPHGGRKAPPPSRTLPMVNEQHNQGAPASPSGRREPDPQAVPALRASVPSAVSRQHCQVCEAETEWDTSKEFGDHDWCKQCGCSVEMFEPHNLPGGCEQHPDATHEPGFGLAGGDFGPYCICNECGIIFGKVPLADDEA